MVDVLYSIERRFMKKTFESIDQHVDVESAYLPVLTEARGCSDTIREVDVDGDGDDFYDPARYDEAIRAVDPDVVVMNHRYPLGEASFHEEYPVVHVRHGASIGRGEIEVTNEGVLGYVDRALAPGERWARRYRRGVDVTVVGIPEADELVSAAAPRERRVLYAPTNHTYGAGSFVNTAEHVVDAFAHTDYELVFRPHPMDRLQEPAASIVERCRERIADVPNILYDEHATPRASMRDADILLSDYSGIVAEWLHTGRPLIQLTDIAADDREVPTIGYTADRVDLETVDELYRHGYPEDAVRHVERFQEHLGIPMDGEAGSRAAREVLACTA